jgi:hypothetical protein
VSDLRGSFVQFRLAPADDEDMGALVDESLRRGQPDAAASACDDGRLVLQSAHGAHLVIDW